MTKDAQETRKLKRGISILNGERQPKTDYDLKCLELVAQRYGIDPEQALSFALFMHSMNVAIGDISDDD